MAQIIQENVIDLLNSGEPAGLTDLGNQPVKNGHLSSSGIV